LPEVVGAMLPYLRQHYGNPSSDYPYGVAAKEAVAKARSEVAELIGARAEEVVFTACATESNNLAILGAAASRANDRRHLVTSAVEHPSVMGPMRRLQAQGWELDILPVDSAGRVDLGRARRAIRPDTSLVSVMLANNETGTLQPVAEIAALAREAGALMHVDAAQAAGKITIDAKALGADLLTLAGHKFHAPKGVGALYVRAGTVIVPLHFGGGQEAGLRPGTENVPHIVALGAAARLAREGLAELSARLERLRDMLHGRLADAVPGLALNGHPRLRLPNTLNLSFPSVPGWQLLAAAPEIAASTGSACHAGNHAVSGVLAAMGLSNDRATGAVRLSIGRLTTEREIETAAALLAEAWRRLST
jgi:cysteine desulfurase